MCFWGFENLGGPLLILFSIERVPHYHRHGLVNREIYFIVDVEDAEYSDDHFGCALIHDRKTHPFPARKALEPVTISLAVLAYKCGVSCPVARNLLGCIQEIFLPPRLCSMSSRFNVSRSVMSTSGIGGMTVPVLLYCV